MTKWTKKYLSVLFYFEQCSSWQAWGLCPTFIATAQQGYVHWIMQWDSRKENNKLLKLSVSKVILQSAGKVTERNLSKRTFFKTYISHDTDITDYLLWLGLGVKKYAQANKNCVFKTHNFEECALLMIALNITTTVSWLFIHSGQQDPMFSLTCFCLLVPAHHISRLIWSLKGHLLWTSQSTR